MSNKNKKVEKKKYLCLYHKYCIDGFSSAWCVWKKYKDQCEYIGVTYNSDPPDVKDRIVFIVDFSYSEKVLLQMIKDSESLIVLDHHATAKKELKGIKDKYKILNMGRSGWMIVWNYFHPKKKVHRFLELVQDYDLWCFKLGLQTKYLNAKLSDIEKTFENYDKLCDEKYLSKIIEEGKIIYEHQMKQVDRLVWRSYMHPYRIGDKVKFKIYYIQSCVLVNEIADKMLNEFKDADFVCITNYNYKYNVTKFYLRSKNDKNGKSINVGTIAKLFGGGGHKHSASFTRKGYWIYLKED